MLVRHVHRTGASRAGASRIYTVLARHVHRAGAVLVRHVHGAGASRTPYWLVRHVHGAVNNGGQTGDL